MDPWHQSILSLYPLNAPYLLACSGGMDSIWLFHLLQEISPPHFLQVCHLDHRMRPESSQDACFVSTLCQKYAVPFHLEVADPPPLSEEEARDYRRAFFLRTAQKIGAQVIFLAHHRDDQVETILHRMIRGGGLASLRGMLPKTALAQDIWLLRPFLSFSRLEVQAEVSKRQLAYREDTTNQDTRYFRNAIRHNLLPLLRKMHPTVDLSLTRLAQQAQELPDAVALEDLRFQTLESFSPYVRSLSLKKYLERYTTRSLDFIHIEQVLRLWKEGQNGAEITLPGKKVLRAYDRLILDSAPESSFVETTIFQGSGYQKTVDYELTWGVEEKREGMSQGEYILVFSPELVTFPLKIRAKTSGDRIRSRGFGGKHHLVKKLLLDAHLPRIYRKHFPLLVDAHDEVLWVPGIRVSEKIQGNGFVLSLKITSFSDEFRSECPEI